MVGETARKGLVARVGGGGAAGVRCRVREVAGPLAPTRHSAPAAVPHSDAQAQWHSAVYTVALR